MRRRVRLYFQQLRDQQCVQEVAALTMVDTHVRERMCIQCDRVVRQDDARVLLTALEIDLLLTGVEQQQQFAGIMDQLAPTLYSAIPITFTKNNRVSATS